MYKLSISLLPTACIISKRDANENRRQAGIVETLPTHSPDRMVLCRSRGPITWEKSLVMGKESQTD